MTIFELQSRAVRGRRRRFDWGRLGPALMFAGTVFGVVVLILLVDRTEATDDAFQAPFAMAATASTRATSFPVSAAITTNMQEIREEVRETWSSDTSSGGTRPDAAH